MNERNIAILLSSNFFQATLEEKITRCKMGAPKEYFVIEVLLINTLPIEY